MLTKNTNTYTLKNKTISCGIGAIEQTFRPWAMDESLDSASTNRTGTTNHLHISLITASIYFLCLSMSSAEQFTKPETFQINDDYEVVSSPKQLGSGLCCLPCFEAFENEDAILEGDAFDIIIVRGQDHKFHQNSDFLVSFATTRGPNHKVVLEVRGGEDVAPNTQSNNADNNNHSKAWFPVIRVSESNESNDSSGDVSEERAWGCCNHNTMPGRITDLNGSFDDNDITSKLAPFLKPGRNPIRYLLLEDERVVGLAQANIFLWSFKDRVVVSDIDGTITKSNARGVIDTILTQNYRYCHDGICQLLSSMTEQPNTQVLYVTSRPIGVASHTRKFLANVRQGDHQLPAGPMLGFGGTVPQILFMELISKNTHHFKAEILWRQVVQPFRKVSHATSASPIFLAGLGNTIMDVQAYHMAGIDLGKIYLIDKRSRISVFDRNLGKEEWTNLTETTDGLFSATIGVPMPRRWYKTQIGSTFAGYSDRRLLSHAIPQETNDCDSLD